MSSRKEEERNEKIIRGLMKLPPNRRCINCNSLGPQYVCINFWTFVCTTCSGIHREFTHRVKSVSMSKFTSQEVEALQQGGNQRAREIFLKDWDTQRQRFPDSSNVERIRDFIKNVYVDRKYAGGKTSDKPPKDTQILRNHEDDPRRASSYHSYSQSPPYDYQYEDRRYGKQTGVLSRKPGSDRSLYERKISSFIYSPGRSSEQMYEDRFANEGSVSRASDFSVSSGGDPFRSDTQSPNFQKDVGFRSPPGYPVRDILIEGVRHQTTNASSEAHARRDANGIPHRQRMASSGSFGSFDSNSTSLASFNSGCTADVPEPDQSAGIQPERMSAFSSLPQSSDSHDYAGLDLFNVSHVKQSAISSAPSVDLFEPMRSSAPSTDLFLSPPTTSASSVDLFQSQPPSSAPSVDLFQCPTSSSAPMINFPQPSLASSSPSVDLFADIINQQSATILLDPKSSEFLVSNNEGWATFDLTQHVESFQSANNPTTAKIPPKDDASLQKFDTPLSINTKRQQQLVQEPSSLLSNTWHGGLPAVQGSSGPVNNQLHIFDQSRNSFEHSVGQHPPAPFDNLPTKDEHVPAYRPPNFNQCYSLKDPEDYSKNGIQRAASADRPGISGISSNSVITSAPFTSSALPFVGGVPSNNADRKSSNPFDIPYDSDVEPGDMFLDMNSLQASLPNTQLQPPFLGGVTQPWFPQNSITPYIPVAPQGSLAYMAGQAPGPQLSNVSSQGPVASLGGNPFA